MNNACVFLDIRRSFYALYHDLFVCSPLGSDAALTCSRSLPMAPSIMTGMREAAGGCHEYKDYVLRGVLCALLRLF